MNKAAIARKTGIPYHKIRKMSDEELRALDAAHQGPPLTEPLADTEPPPPDEEDEEVCVRVWALCERQEGDTRGLSLVQVREVPLSVLKRYGAEVGPVRDLMGCSALIEREMERIRYNGIR